MREGTGTLEALNTEFESPHGTFFIAISPDGTSLVCGSGRTAAHRRAITQAARQAPFRGDLPLQLFGVERAQRGPGYADFAAPEPPLKLVLSRGDPGQDTRLDHPRVEADSTGTVAAATGRRKEVGLAIFKETDTSCCYALRDQVWVHGPDRMGKPRFGRRHLPHRSGGAHRPHRGRPHLRNPRPPGSALGTDAGAPARLA
ncbi:hypothetical protein ACK8N7_01500 [Streptomyces griseobrunneus]